jgi:hypothetical protein
VVFWLGKRVLSRLDDVDTYIRTELRALDVRLSVVEALLAIKR